MFDSHFVGRRWYGGSTGLQKGLIRVAALRLLTLLAFEGVRICSCNAYNVQLGQSPPPYCACVHDADEAS